MYIMRYVPVWVCFIAYWIMQSHFNMNILSSTLLALLLLEIGYAINCIPLKFPEDEAEPYFQFRLNIVVIIMFSIVSVIGTVSLFNVNEFDKCAYFIWIYFNVISGYFSSEFNKS